MADPYVNFGSGQLPPVCTGLSKHTYVERIMSALKLKGNGFQGKGSQAERIGQSLQDDLLRILGGLRQCDPMPSRADNRIFIGPKKDSKFWNLHNLAWLTVALLQFSAEF